NWAMATGLEIEASRITDVSANGLEAKGTTPTEFCPICATYILVLSVLATNTAWASGNGLFLATLVANEMVCTEALGPAVTGYTLRLLRLGLVRLSLATTICPPIIAACTGLTPTFSTATAVSPETSKWVVVPGFVPLSPRMIACSTLPDGSPPGPEIGLDTGRKVSPQPTRKVNIIATATAAALLKTIAGRPLNRPARNKCMW